MKKPIKAKEIDVEVLLLIGIYELLYLKTAQYATVSEVVDGMKHLKKTWAVNLSNAVLRTFIRQKETLLQQVNQNPSSKYAHPNWLIRAIKHSWPEQWQNILTQNNIQAPMCLRINHRKISTEDYLKLLSEKGISAKPSAVSDSALLLTKAQNVIHLPKFSDGFVSIQDVSAQRAADLLQLKPKQKILDACAAPGGKTCHILEKEPQLTTLIALDESEERTKKIYDNLSRLHLEASVKIAKAENLESWWDGELFDRILLDAPCSATGVIRRHPDIKLLRKETDIKNLVQLQRNILSNLWKTLKPNGLMLYVTCSILPQENSENIRWFLTKTSDAELVSITENEMPGLQLFPGESEGDGFYYCLLKKSLTSEIS